jgi:hypothetical protein
MKLVKIKSFSLNKLDKKLSHANMCYPIDSWLHIIN